MGTATYALEFLQSAPPLDQVYVPIGLGSSICGVERALCACPEDRDLGVVSSVSPSYALSFTQRQIVEAPSKTLPGRRPRLPRSGCTGNGNHLEQRGAHRRGCRSTISPKPCAFYFQDTHNVAEGAGAAPLAAALKEQNSEQMPAHRSRAHRRQCRS